MLIALCFVGIQLTVTRHNYSNFTVSVLELLVRGRCVMHARRNETFNKQVEVRTTPLKPSKGEKKHGRKNAWNWSIERTNDIHTSCFFLPGERLALWVCLTVTPPNIFCGTSSTSFLQIRAGRPRVELDSDKTRYGNCNRKKNYGAIRLLEKVNNSRDVCLGVVSMSSFIPIFTINIPVCTTGTSSFSKRGYG